MGTSWEAIETMAMTFIKNDKTLDFDMAYRLPVFYNRMRAYMELAIPLFNRPPEMLGKLADCTEPEFDDATAMLTEAVSGEYTLETGMSGYDLCAVGVIGEDTYGRMHYTPVAVSAYDSATGTVTIAGDLEAGTELTIECYKGGSFQAELNRTEEEILAYAIYNVWEHRFDNNVLERTAKIRDGSFTTISEASQTTANTARQKAADETLYGKLRAYQDNCEYIKVVLWGRH